jgi:hypothetical protein
MTLLGVPGITPKAYLPTAWISGPTKLMSLILYLRIQFIVKVIFQQYNLI